VLHAWPEKRRTRDDESMLRRDLLPIWRNKPAAEIGPAEVVNLTDAIIALRQARRSAEHVRLLVSRIFNYSIKRARRFTNPAAHLSISGGKSKPRSRWLSDAEILTFWQGLDSAGAVFAARLRAELLLMQRPGEVAAMEWGELDERGSWWIIPGEKKIPVAGGELEVGTKNKLEHSVYLPRLFWEVIEPIRELGEGGRFVFPSSRAPGQPLWGVNKVLTALVARLELRHFTPHDLRRTGTTNLQRLGHSLLVDPIVNHVPAGVRKNYNLWQFREEKRVAMEAWERHLRGILGL
jgi:integrase